MLSDGHDHEMWHKTVTKRVALTWLLHTPGQCWLTCCCLREIGEVLVATAALWLGDTGINRHKDKADGRVGEREVESALHLGA